MTNTEAARVLSALLKQQQDLPPKYRDLNNEELLAMGKAIKTLRRASQVRNKKEADDHG